MKKYALYSAVLGMLFAGVFPVAATAEDNDFAKKMDSYLQDDKNVEQIGNALERFFKKKRDEQQAQAEQEEARQMEEQFKNPVAIDIGESPMRGPKEAKVTIVEFSDFQCPYCKRGADTMEDIRKEYADKVNIVFKNLPLPFHPNAKPAAIAALAAGRQGKYWEMHDMLFDKQQELSPELYTELAKQLNLDIEKFNKDLNDEALAKQIDDDAALATKLGIRGTPGYFVNGVQVRGARPLPYFKQLIDRWLEIKG